MNISAISASMFSKSIRLFTTRPNCPYVVGRLSVFSHLSASLLRVLDGAGANKGIN